MISLCLLWVFRFSKLLIYAFLFYFSGLTARHCYGTVKDKAVWHTADFSTCVTEKYEKLLRQVITKQKQN